MLAGWLAGAARATRGLAAAPITPDSPPPLAPAGQPPRPPRVAAVAEFLEPEPIVHFPIIEEAARDLDERRIFTREDYDQLDAESKAAAFTAANVHSALALQRLQEALAQSVAQGDTLAEFRAAVDDALQLSPGHVENIFRTNVAQAYSTGLMETLAHPLVQDEFPYVAYHAVHDSRVRPHHLALEHRGLDSTNIYRRDDPILERFTPPWEWNCVPFESLIQTARGPLPIGVIKKGEMVLTHKGRWRAVIGTHRSEGPTELVALEIEGQSLLVRATANHRVLTQRGWVEVGSLNIEDQVYQLCQSAQTDLIMLEIKDRSQAQNISDGPVSFDVRPSGVLNLNSNVGRGEKEVQPKREGLLVEIEGNGALFEGGSKSPLMRAHSNNSVDVLSWVETNRVSSSLDHLGAYFGTASRAMDTIGRSHLLGSFGMKSILQLVRSRSAAKDNAALCENSPYRAEGNAGFIGDVLHGNATGFILREQRLDAARPSRQPRFGAFEVSSASVWLSVHNYNCKIKAAQIKSIRRIPWSKPVYNLSVAEDESYICDGIAMHNCRCALVPLNVEDAARAGVREAKDWLRTGQAPVSPQWVQAPPFEPPPGWSVRK